MEITREASSQGVRLLGNCAGCSLPLPLRLPESHEQASQWECAGCGKTYRAILLEDWPADFQQNVRPASSRVEPEAAPAPRDAMADSAVEPVRPRPDTAALPGRRVARCKLETAVSRQFDTEIALGVNLNVRPQGKPFAERIRWHGVQPYMQPTVQRFREIINHSSEQLGDLFTALKVGKSVELRVTESISHDGLARVAEDRDLFVNLGITLPSGNHLSRHALRMSMVAMSVGATLDWDERTLLDLGIGCLIHDLGMLELDGATYRGKRSLSASDFAEISKHPLLTFELLQKHLDRIPTNSRMVAYQLHERCNGTGYPRGYPRSRIHSLARIAAVADTFVSLISPHPYGPGMIPYDAVKKILFDTKEGLFDPEAVRGLLNTISLFPIGSYVKLNDGRLGKVVRSTGEYYLRPIVEVSDSGRPPKKPELIDLSAQRELQISGALAQQDQSRG